VASPAFVADENVAELNAHGPKCVLLVAAARSASVHVEVTATPLVKTMAMGIPNDFCAELSPMTDARFRPGMYQLFSSRKKSFHHGARDSDTTWYFILSESECVLTVLVLACFAASDIICETVIT